MNDRIRGGVLPSVTVILMSALWSFGRSGLRTNELAMMYIKRVCAIYYDGPVAALGHDRPVTSPSRRRDMTGRRRKSGFGLPSARLSSFARLM